ncbi:DNase I-like protein [Suillus weaverae]|nr:DNase I-like protein [Suillus weaverae]
MRKGHIGLMAVQETHLLKLEEDILNNTPGFRILVLSSIDPDHTNSKGVAIVINKYIVNISNIKTHNLVPGRAILTTICWHKEKLITILAVYAPNNPLGNQAFWTDLLDKLRDLPELDILLGDFNLVEDALDRLPAKNNSQGTMESLMTLRMCYRLKDVWHRDNPDKLAYTFMQSARQGGCQSRIDRIYVKESFLPFSKEWDIQPPGISTNHLMVSACISDRRMPFIGKGWWALPLYILQDETLKKNILKLGRTLQQETEQTKINRTDLRNPQEAFNDFKVKATKLCRDALKKTIPIKKNKLRKQLEATRLPLSENIPGK